MHSCAEMGKMGKGPKSKWAEKGTEEGRWGGAQKGARIAVSGKR